MDIALIVAGVLAGILIIIGLTMVVIDKVQDTRRAREDQAWRDGFFAGQKKVREELAPPF